MSSKHSNESMPASYGGDTDPLSSDTPEWPTPEQPIQEQQPGQAPWPLPNYQQGATGRRAEIGPDDPTIITHPSQEESAYPGRQPVNPMTNYRPAPWPGLVESAYVNTPAPIRPEDPTQPSRPANMPTPARIVNQGEQWDALQAQISAKRARERLSGQ